MALELVVPAVVQALLPDEVADADVAELGGLGEGARRRRLPRPGRARDEYVGPPPLAILSHISRPPAATISRPANCDRDGEGNSSKGRILEIERHVARNPVGRACSSKSSGPLNPAHQIRPRLFSSPNTNASMQLLSFSPTPLLFRFFFCFFYDR